MYRIKASLNKILEVYSKIPKNILQEFLTKIYILKFVCYTCIIKLESNEKVSNSIDKVTDYKINKTF